MNRWQTIGAVFMGAMLFLTPSQEARACGGFFSKVNSSDVVAMSDIRVLMIHDQGHTDQLVQIAYSGAAGSFAWVYPVAGNPEVSEVKDSPFQKLDELTRPQITITTSYESSGGGGLGCFGSSDSAGPSGLGNKVVPPVQVWKSGQVGSFDYVVITAVTADDMLDWLNQNGFQVPGSTRAVLDHYVSLKWFFVAMKVSVEAVEGDVPSTTVVRLSYDSSDLRYPLRMVSLAPAAETSLELYVIAPTGMAPDAPFSSVGVETSKLAATSEETSNYDQLFSEALAQANGHALVKEFEQNNRLDPKRDFPGLVGLINSSMVLIRYRTVLTPGEMTQDIQFSPRDFTEMLHHHDLFYRPGEKSEIPLLLVIGGLLFAGHRTLRRRRRR